MRILLTNDDGLRAPGIHAMHSALTDVTGEFGCPLGESTFTCAPLTVQSATSHGMTFHQPLMVSEIDVSETMRGVAVDGRPADCVKLAFASLWSERFGNGSRPDLVVSGINAGANVGINVIYSGTVAAALEASFLGSPAIAVSLHLGGKPSRWDVAGRWAREAIQAILDAGLMTDTNRPSPPCLNVNLPLCSEDGPMPPIRVCPMNTHGHCDVYERRINPAGEVYYWAATGGLDFRDQQSDGDVDLLFQRSITVTPLWHDLTDTASLSTWRDRLGCSAT
jgi:5'/3'-nucleotidase